MDHATLARKIRMAIFDDAEARGRVLQDSMDSVIERELRAAIPMMPGHLDSYTYTLTAGVPLNTEIPPSYVNGYGAPHTNEHLFRKK